MKLVIYTKRNPGRPRPLWIEVAIDSAYLDRVRELRSHLRQRGGGYEVLATAGKWQPRQDYQSYRLEALCDKYRLKFRLVSQGSDHRVFSNGILMEQLLELNARSGARERVFHGNDQPVLMAIYYSTRNSAV
ncbi:hypothetical protein [Marinobacter sp. SS21]|uniref:hypothetical protein n=1 Tax=Marinobacter sp. SS21 TaxID=2979460 RepID=UPI00232E7F81|nr:hypothetical protein [Marinobacter sp. SS21]MDC0662669.1 hypothetical protein [Marinobacter sp. SS21]